MFRLVFFIMLTVFLLICVTSCFTYGVGEFKAFTQQNQNVSSTLKLNGYYYYANEIESTYYKTLRKYIQPIFLWEDGTVRIYPIFDAFTSSEKIASFSPEDNTFENIHSIFIQSLNDTDKGRKPVGWGQYRIDGNTLWIQYFEWGPSNVGDRELGRRKCIILSDTSFVQIESSYAKSNQVDREHHVYYFREYSPKPDSTNWTHDFIKSN